MAITPYNLVQGPATLYWATFGTTEPAITNAALIAAPGAGWTDVGGIADGTSVIMEEDLTYTDQGVDQLPMAVGARLTKMALSVTATLAEATLQNYQLARNQLATVTVGSGGSAGVTTLDPTTGSPSTQPTYTALMIDGWAPTLSSGVAAKRRVIVRKCLSSSKLRQEYEKSKMNLYDTAWAGYWVSNSIAPYDIYDQTT